MAITITCDACGESYEVAESLAGKKAKCPCGASIPIPSPEAVSEAVPDVATETATKEIAAAPESPSVPESSAPSSPDEKRCPKCEQPVTDDAVICVNCGHNLKLGLNVKTIARAKKVGSFGMALGIAAAAAVISGLIWAGIAILLKVEIGWVAIGVGALTGFGAVAFTDERSMRLGLAAAGLALCGLLIGKIITANFFFGGAERELIKVMKSNPEYLENAMVWKAIESKNVQPEFAEWLKKNDPEEVDIPENLMTGLTQKIKAQVAAMKPEERENALKTILSVAMGSVGYMDRLKSVLSYWDILWFFLALGGAWKIGSGTTD